MNCGEVLCKYAIFLLMAKLADWPGSTGFGDKRNSDVHRNFSAYFPPAGRGPIVVNIPRPQRYALHKLLVCGERPQEQRTKANKDVVQAAALLDYLLNEDAEEIGALWVDVMGRGPGWKRRLEEGFNTAVRMFPDRSFASRMESAVLQVKT